MKKATIIDEVARRCGNEDPVFKADKLSHIFDWIVLELAQEDALSLLNKENSFTLNATGCTVANTILNVSLATVLNLDTDHACEQVIRLRVPEWGAYFGLLKKVPDWEFEYAWTPFAVNPLYTGRPRMWRIYPNPTQLQLWPPPDTDNATATVLIQWRASPAVITGADDMTDIQPSDLPTVLAGCYRYASLFSDDTLRDAFSKFAALDWVGGVQRMKGRITKAQSTGRDNRIRYVDF